MPERTIALITGSTDGLGREVAFQLAEAGYDIIVHGRHTGRGREVASQIEGRSGRKCRFIQADFSDLAEVRRFAQRVLDNVDRLDLLVSNAGVGPGGPENRREESQNGIELRFAVNYLAGYLLTSLLLPALRSSGPSARIVNVASAGQAPIDFDDPMMERHYERELAYCRSKLAQIMGSFDFAEELKGSAITVNAIHPAEFMPTTMVRETGFEIASTLAEGVTAVMNLAVAPELQSQTGLYFDGVRAARAHEFAYDPDARRRLRALTARYLGEDAVIKVS